MGMFLMKSTKKKIDTKTEQQNCKAQTKNRPRTKKRNQQLKQRAPSS